MKGLLLEAAEAVQHAVEAMTGNPGDVLGRGADGGPSARIDRVAEEAVLRVLDYEEASLNVLSAEAKRPSSSIRSTEPTPHSAASPPIPSPSPSATSACPTSRRRSSGIWYP